ncbi:hypothetical protein ABZ330_00135 [Streptomyces sp. NPDC006172]|uniref:hypothetical protein n=1 Tax=Streptomyces sp. NPDC006172 TaxID=3154470 RepID=UPI0034032B82
MTTQITDASTFRSRQDARERNEWAYETTIAVKELPSGRVAFRATPDAVLVTATGMDVLAEWLYVMRGTVTTVDLPSGQTVWTLRTQTWSDSPAFPPVPVFVSVVLPSDEPVMHEIRAAVAA